jgi:hypothetical protein
MSDLFKSIKKNIAPFQNIIREKTNMFIETFNDSFSDSESDEPYSDDFETDSDGELSIPPKQQIFNEHLFKMTNSYSPINTEKVICFEKNEDENQEIKKEDEENKIIEEIKEDIENKELNKYELLNDELLIKNLEILTNININQKLYINYLDNNNKLNFEILFDESYFPQLSRWYYSQNRNITINAIEKLINLTIEQLNIYKEMLNEELVKNYINLLNKSINGLKNLKITYETDEESIFKLNNIITFISENL